jgi:predicted cupin superfamily sugar epimerase
MLTAEKIIELLNLKPLQNEGGFFRETWRSSDTVPENALPERYPDSKSFGTAIYYLLTPDTFSRLHRLPTDEVLHFYLGEAVEMLMLFQDGSSEIVILGHNIEDGEFVQVVIPKGTWFGARIKPGGIGLIGGTDAGGFALMGTTMAPGFDFSDYESDDRNSLPDRYPDREELIKSLTGGNQK